MKYRVNLSSIFLVDEISKKAQIFYIPYSKSLI